MILKTKFIVSSLLIIAIGFSIIIICKFNDRSNNNYRWIKSADGLNLRELPNTSSRVITVIPYGSKVRLKNEYKTKMIIDNIKGRWVNISWENKSGWVFNGYLSRDTFFAKKLRRITAKQGLPYDKEYKYTIPYNSTVEILKQNVYFDYSIVKWKEKKYKVHSGFLAKLGSKKNPILDDIKTYIQSNDRIYQKKGDIAIKNIDNYYLITILSTNIELGASGKWGFYDYLLKNENNKWKLCDIYNCGRRSCYIRLFDINNDNSPDAIAYGGCCNHSYFKIYLSHKNNILKESLSIELSPSSSSHDFSYEDHVQVLSLGPCNNTKVKYKRELYTYDCEKNKLAKK